MDAISGLPAQIAQLISGSEGAVNPYASIPSAWVSPQVFVALSIGNLIVVMGSALTWVVLGWRWLRGERPRTGLWVLWLLYAAFAFQVALGTFVDRTGMLGGNLQYRAFAPFATLAAGLLAVGLSEIRPRAVIRVAGGIALAALAVAATLKASNEPVVSNKWTFYSPAEITGLEWADANLASTPTWIGPDERLGAAYLTELGVPGHGDRWTHDELDPSVRAFVVSDIVRLQASRMGVTLPAVASRIAFTTTAKPRYTEASHSLGPAPRSSSSHVRPPLADRLPDVWARPAAVWDLSGRDGTRSRLAA